MTTLVRVRVALGGTAVTGPGVSTFYSAGAASVIQPALKAFYTSLLSAFPIGLTITVPTAGETIDDNTGAINGAWAAGSGGTLTGAGAGNYPAGVGARIVWETAGITGGRRVRGSTYLVPLAGGSYDADGSIIAAGIVSFDAAASTLVTALGGEMVILSRVTSSHSGTSHAVTSSRTPDKVSWLRSRRT